MGSLDEQPEPSRLKEETPNEKTNRTLVVIAVVIIAVLYSMFMERAGIAGYEPEQALARAVGATIGLLILPSIVGLIVGRIAKYPAWHYAFAGTFAVVLLLHLVGSFA